MKIHPLAVVSLVLLYVTTSLTSQQSLTDYTFEDTDLSVSLVDIDGDEDMDVFIGADSRIYFLENEGDGMYSDNTEIWAEQLPKVDWSEITMDFADLDGDGDFDLSLLGDEFTDRELYMNEGTSEFPVFKLEEDSPLKAMDLSVLDGSFEVGFTDAVHSWADLDNDGDEDCIVGGKQGWFLYFENVGTDKKPQLTARKGADNPLDGYRVRGGDEGSGMQYESSPYLIDIDVDGDYDLFSGNQMGTFHYYENVGTATEPSYEEKFERYNPLHEISVEKDSKVAISDDDCDGVWEAYYSGEGERSIKVTDLNKYQVQPVKVIIDQDALNIEDGVMLLSGGYPSGGEWSGNGVVDGQFFPEEVGLGFHRITYTVMAYYGCELTTTEILTIGSEIEVDDNLPDGVLIESKANLLSIINWENAALSFSLFDNIGNRILAQEIIGSEEIYLDVETAGLYVINISTENSSYSKKIFLNN